MRCECCDKILSDYEATLIIKSTGEYADTCLKCLEGLGIDIQGNNRLKRKHDEISEELEAQLDDELKELVRHQRYDSWESDD